MVVKALCPGKEMLNKKKYFAKDQTVKKATAQSFYRPQPPHPGYLPHRKTIQRGQ
jgi:hypothetical protein